MINTGADFVIGGTKVVETIDEVMTDAKHEIIEYTIYRDEEIRDLYPFLGCLRQTIRFGESYVGRGPVSRLLKRTIAEAAPFHDDLRIGEDGIWNLEVMSRCNCVCIAKAQWYWYWKNPDSAIHRYDPGMYSASMNYQKAVEKLLNLEVNNEYLAFIYGLFDHLWHIQESIFRYSDEDNTKLRKDIYYAIHTEYPWTKIKEWRFFKICPPKYKIMALLYRFHLLFFCWEARGKLLHK